MNRPQLGSQCTVEVNAMDEMISEMLQQQEGIAKPMELVNLA